MLFLSTTEVPKYVHIARVYAYAGIQNAFGKSWCQDFRQKGNKARLWASAGVGQVPRLAFFAARPGWAMYGFHFRGQAGPGPCMDLISAGQAGPGPYIWICIPGLKCKSIHESVFTTGHKKQIHVAK